MEEHKLKVDYNLGSITVPAGSIVLVFGGVKVKALQEAGIIAKPRKKKQEPEEVQVEK